MKRLISLPVFLLTFLMVLLSAAATWGGIKTKYTEDFLSKTYCDTLNTTALWDTVSGELKLPPFAITLVGSYDTPNNALEVAVHGDYVLLTEGGHPGLIVFDITDPTNPLFVTSLDFPETAQGPVVISGNYAYVGLALSAGLYVVDITDPTSPFVAGTYTGLTRCRDVAVDGDYSYIAAGSGGVVVLDISDPTNPSLLGSVGSIGYAHTISWSGDYVFASTEVNGLKIIDVSDPTSPSVIGTYIPPGGYTSQHTISGDRCYLAGNYNGSELDLMVVDITDPTNPVLIGVLETPNGMGYGVEVSGDHLYVGENVGGVRDLLRIDISDPANPVLADRYETNSPLNTFTLCGEYAHVGAGVDGLKVLKVAEATLPPKLAGTCSTSGGPLGVYVSGDHAFVADYLSGLQVIDIGNPAVPTLVGAYDTPGQAQDVFVSGDYAFVADYDSGLQVIDIGNPVAPTLVGTYDTPHVALAVDISGNHAFLADGHSGLRIIDISDPTIPSLAGAYDTPGSAQGVCVSGDYAFVADGSGKLHIIDISNPAAPTLSSTYNPLELGGAVAVCVTGDYAFVAVVSYGLHVVDISEPTNPVLAGSYLTPGSTYGVCVSGDYAFVADGSGGLRIIDISNPATPTSAGTYGTPGNANSVFISDDYALVTDTGSLQIIEVFQRRFESDANTAWSLSVDQSNDTITRARLNTTQTDSIRWELSSNNGANWEEVVPGSDWHVFASTGSDLLWRTTHVRRVSHPTINPTCFAMEIDWRYAYPVIATVADVPSDQGGCVAVNWKSSAYDFYDLRTVTHYSVWRAVDPIQMSEAGNEAVHVEPQDVKQDFRGPAYRIERTPQGEYYWEWVDNVTGYYFEGYSYTAPTRYDSMGVDPAMHYFQVVAHTSDQWTFWVSPPDSGYSVDNLAPYMPMALVGEQVVSPEGLALSWHANTEPDLGGYAVYRGLNEDFEPGPGNLIAAVSDTTVFDGEWRWDSGFYYKVSAIDIHENESPFALLGPTDVTGVDSSDIPRMKYLSQNRPNPFNPSTTIAFGLDEPTDVALVIYDASGRLVRKLVERRYEAGRFEETWDGTNAKGAPVASGVYFYRLEAERYSHTKKMVLLR